MFLFHLLSLSFVVESVCADTRTTRKQKKRAKREGFLLYFQVENSLKNVWGWGKVIVLVQVRVLL